MKKSSVSKVIVIFISAFLLLILNPFNISHLSLRTAINPANSNLNLVHAQENQINSSTENKSSETPTTENPDSEDNQPPTEESQDTNIKDDSTESEQQGEKTQDNENQPVMVQIDGKDLFPIAIQIGEVEREERAKEIEERIIRIAEDGSILPEDLSIVNFEGLRLIQANDITIVGFGKSDAKSANQTLPELAEERLEIIKNSIIEYRQSRTEKSIIRGIITAIIATVGLIIAWILVNQTLPHYFNKFQQWQQQRFRTVRFQGLQFLSSSQINKLIGFTFNLLRFFLIILLLYIYIPLILSSFPITKPYGVKLLRAFWNAIVETY